MTERLFAGKFVFAASAAAALLATALLLGGIDRLADHYASGHDTVRVSPRAV